MLGSINLPYTGRIVPSVAVGIVTKQIDSACQENNKLTDAEEIAQANYQIIAQYTVPLGIGLTAGAMFYLLPLSISLPVVLSVSGVVDYSFFSANKTRVF